MTKLPGMKTSVTLQYDNSPSNTIYGKSDSNGAPTWTTLTTANALVYPIDTKVKTIAMQQGVYMSHEAILDYDDIMALYNSTCPGKRLRAVIGGKNLYVVDGPLDKGGLGKYVILVMQEGA